MKTALLIIHYNDYESTKELLNNVSEYSIIDQIVIVDNHSKKELREKLKEFTSSKVHVIYNKENKGYGYGINVGMKYLKEKYGNCNVIVSNSDIIIEKEEDIKKLVLELKKEGVGVVAPVIDEHGVLNRGWKLVSTWKEILFNIPKFYTYFERKYRYYKKDYYKGKLTEVDVLSGCFFLITTDTLERVGYFDEQIFLYYEENVLAQKLRRVSLKEVLVNDVKVIHNHSVTIDKNVGRLKKYQILKESGYYYNKEYNHANRLQLVLFKGATNLTSFFLKFVTK